MDSSDGVDETVKVGVVLTARVMLAVELERTSLGLVGLVVEATGSGVRQDANGESPVSDKDQEAE